MEWISAESKKSEDLNHNKLEQVLGFLVYVSRTYPDMTPNLKGVCLTLDHWIGGRYADLWRLLESVE